MGASQNLHGKRGCAGPAGREDPLWPPPASLVALGGGEGQQQGAPRRILTEHTQEAS